MKLNRCPTYAILVTLFAAVSSGCSLFPEVRHRDRIHNPFPQLSRVAVLPFYNQSDEPTVDTDLVARQYYAALQAIPGFEVLPVGVVREAVAQYSQAFGAPRGGADFQILAQRLGVDAVVVGSVTDFDAYYPPRMAMTVHWYAANEGFHPIPAGYGLPWGTEGEKEIPKRIVREAEFELARSQLATQTPDSPTQPAAASIHPQTVRAATNVTAENDPSDVFALDELDAPPSPPDLIPLQPLPVPDGTDPQPMSLGVDMPPPLDGIPGGAFPIDWPDATDLIPNPPVPMRPALIVNRKPVLSYTRLYRGDDPYFTDRLSDHVETGDDARPDGWQGYLKT